MAARGDVVIRLAISTYAYAPSVGGVERHTQRLARALVGRGNRVTIVTAERDGAPIREIDPGGVEIRRVAAGRGGRWRNMATYIAASSAELVRLRDQIDVVHIQQALYPAAALTVLARTLRKPVVVRNSGSGLHGAVQLMSRLPFGRASLGMIARGAATVSLSSEMTDEMRGAGFTDITEIPNGIQIAPLGDRDEARRKLGIPSSARMVLVVGRLDREKGTALLATAWPLVRTTDALLVVCGDGPEAPVVQGLARARLEGSVADVAPYYAAADAFVLPSESEGISNALLEAMAAALPCVATSVGGNRAVIATPTVGTLGPPNDPSALAREIDRLLGDPARARSIGESARDHVARNWSFDAMVLAYERLYGRLLG